MVAGNDKIIYEATLSRSSIGVLGGLVAVVLGILGLVGVYPLILTAVATLCIAVMLLFEGAAVAAEYKHVLTHLEGGSLDKSELGSGMTMEMLAGVTGIVLSILALLMIVPYTLLSVAIIVFGGGLLLGSGVIARLNAIKIGKSGADSTLSVLAEESAKAGAAFQALIGLAVVILGILAV